MTLLCPHFLQDYFDRVQEVLMTYESQISQLPTQILISRLTERGVITHQDNQLIICQSSKNEQQMRQLMNIIQRRVWGIEAFILVLLEEDYNAWLAENLFNSYLHHVVAFVKQKANNDKCECQISNASSSSTISNMKKYVGSWMGKVDDTLDQIMYPTTAIALSSQLSLLRKVDNKYKDGNRQSVHAFGEISSAIASLSIMDGRGTSTSACIQLGIVKSTTKEQPKLDNFGKVTEIDAYDDECYLEWDNYDLVKDEEDIPKPKIQALEQKTSQPASFSNSQQPKTTPEKIRQTNIKPTNSVSRRKVKISGTTRLSPLGYAAAQNFNERLGRHKHY